MCVISETKRYANVILEKFWGSPKNRMFLTFDLQSTFSRATAPRQECLRRPVEANFQAVSSEDY